jgi:hypothetical protein
MGIVWFKKNVFSKDVISLGIVLGYEFDFQIDEKTSSTVISFSSDFFRRILFRVVI